MCSCGDGTSSCTEDTDELCAAFGVVESTTDDSYRSSPDRDGDLAP